MKKGFTLIELLAVIVILAIIALIAVPIVVNIINDSKVSSDEQSIELYLDTSKKIITKKQLSNPSFNPDICKIQSNGDLDCYKGNNKIETLQVDVKGTIPEKGTIELKDNKFIYKNILLNGKYYYERGILVGDADNNNEISIGDKYTYKVNDTDTFNFYVLSFNEDETVNLIMDRNICGFEDANDTRNGKVATEQNKCLISWYDDGDNPKKYNNDINNKGPITVMQGLYNATRSWNNVPNMNLIYDDALDNCINNNTINTSYGYKAIYVENGIAEIINKTENDIIIIGKAEKPLKARLPKYSELIVNEVKESNLLKPWLVEYLHDANKSLYENNQKISGIYGYWLLTSYSGRADFGRFVSNGDLVNNPNTNYTSLEYGIRPVITVPITDLAN